jgi:hypothetical protein
MTSKPDFTLELGLEYFRSIWYLRERIKHSSRKKHDYIKIKITAPGLEQVYLSVFIQLSDLYFLAFENKHGMFYFQDYPSTIECKATSRQLRFRSTYPDLKPWTRNLDKIIDQEDVYSALQNLAHKKINDVFGVADKDRLAILAFLTSEAVRLQMVASGFGSVFTSWQTKFLTKRYIRREVTNYSKSHTAGDDYVLVSPG